MNNEIAARLRAERIILATDTAHARATRPTAPRATAGPPVKLQVQQAARRRRA